MIDTREPSSPTPALAALVMAAFLITFGAACGGGDPAPSAEAPAGTEPAADATAPTAGGEPGNAAVVGMGDGTATVRGTVSYAGTVPQLRPVTMDADPQCAAKHDGPVPNQVLWLGDGNTLGNVFVQVKGGLAEREWTAPTAPAVMDQQGCIYKPHVMGVLLGQPLRFLNSDELLHNVHGLPQVNREFNIGMPASVRQSDVRLNQPEPLFPVKCDVHPWMQSYVAVMTHPFFTVTDENGSFELTNLPAGTYELEAWHERLGTQTATVTVEDGDTASTDFSFSPPQS